MRTVNEMTWAQRCAADAQARDWHLEYGRTEFYHSPKWGQLTAVADGTTTVTDVADALAAGTATPYQQALAASFWVDAAEYLAGRARDAWADAWRGHPHEDLTDDLGQVPWLVDDDELAAAQQRRADADAALVAARHVRDAAVEREDHVRRWQEAEDEAAYHEAGAQAALEAEVAGPWRTAVDVEYDQICADYGNDGHPDNDRHISAQDKAAQAAAVAAIAERTALPTGAVWDAVREVSDRYARDHTDTATLDQPDWDQVADHWTAMKAARQEHRDSITRADHAATAEETRPERENDQVAPWGELAESHPTAREAFWDARDDLGVTAEDDIDPAELDAAYTAAGETITAAADLPTPDLPTPGPAAVIEADALAAEDAAIEASIAAAYGVEQHAAERDHLTSPDPVLWGPVAADLLDELDQARAQLEAGDIPSEREHELAQRIEHLEDQTAHYAQTAAELGTTTDALLAELLTELDATGPDHYPGDHSPYWDHHDAPPATAPQQQPGDEPAATRLPGADADAWSAAEGTPVAELPASGVVEGRPTGQAPGQPRPIDALTAPHDATQAGRLRPADEQASSPQDSAPATNRPESSAAGPNGRDLAAGSDTGEDPIVRARHAVARLDVSRQAPAGWRAGPDTPTRSASAGVEPPALGPREPGW